MEGVILAGASAAASIISLGKDVSDFRERKRVGRREREERLSAINQKVKNLRDKIPQMIEENGKLLGYKELHKDAQELLNVATDIEKFILNADYDKSKASRFIEDSYSAIKREAEPIDDSLTRIARQTYPFLNEDKDVDKYLSSIHDTLITVGSLVDSGYEPDKKEEIKKHWTEIVSNSRGLMRCLDERILKLSTKINEESKAFEIGLRTGGVNEG